MCFKTFKWVLKRSQGYIQVNEPRLNLGFGIFPILLVKYFSDSLKKEWTHKLGAPSWEAYAPLCTLVFTEWRGRKWAWFEHLLQADTALCVTCINSLHRRSLFLHMHLYAHIYIYRFSLFSDIKFFFSVKSEAKS